MAASPSPSPDVDQLAIGSVLDGRYRIDAVLGTGGMGRVYRGEHTGIGRAVAIKVLHADLTRNRDAAARFQREALASGRLDHPNIVGVSDFGVLDDGCCFLVMEALEGESLGDRLERERRIAWPEALAILRGVLAGLRHAHERGVVHRDIKPDNIYLARKGGEHLVKILDFGIAKLAAGIADDPAATRAGLTVGTPAYLSPEQAVGGEITPASDIYSATIVLFEMIAGRPPFDDKDPLAMLGAHVSRTPPTLAEIAPELAAGLPPGLEDLIQRGLAKTASERIASADEYLAWIDAVLAAGVPHASDRDARGSAPVIIPPHDDLSITPLPTLTPSSAVATVAPSRLPTPVPGAPRPGPDTPIIGLTAAIDAIAPGELGKTSAATDSLPRSTRAVSLADAEPIPRRWLITGAAIFGGLVVIAVVLLIALRGGADSTSAAGDVQRDTPAMPPFVQPVTVPRLDPEERRVKLNAALYELEKGKDCATRKAAIAKIVELEDPSAIPALRQARYRMRGGLLGLGSENTNACLTRDAEAAIKKLQALVPAKG